MKKISIIIMICFFLLSVFAVAIPKDSDDDENDLSRLVRELREELRKERENRNREKNDSNQENEQNQIEYIQKLYDQRKIIEEAKQKFNAIKTVTCNRGGIEYLQLLNAEGKIVCLIEKNSQNFFSKLITGKTKKGKKIIEHLNRNQFNKEAKGFLTHLIGDLYIDEAGCIWTKISFWGTGYHDRHKNVKFVRPDPNNKNSSFETVREIAYGEDRNNLQFTGKNVRLGDYRGTYNFYDATPTIDYINSFIALKIRDPELYNKPFINYRPDETTDMLKHPHIKMDEDLHNMGYKDYAVFDEQEGTPIDKEKLLILKIVYPYKYGSTTSFKREMEKDFDEIVKGKKMKIHSYKTKEWRIEMKKYPDMP